MYNLVKRTASDNQVIWIRVKHIKLKKVRYALEKKQRKKFNMNGKKNME